MELRRKLRTGGIAAEVVDAILEDLADAGLQSDLRFAESFVHSRSERGYGPVRIRQELHQHGLDELLVDGCLREHEAAWQTQAGIVRRKRFGERPPGDFRERARQARFLAYRGFTQDQIEQALQDSGG